MRIQLWTYFSFIIFLCACSPKVKPTITKSYPPLDYRETVSVLGLNEDAPANAEILGTVKIGDSGFSTNCGYDVAIEKAINEARKVGGNAIQITKHIPPNLMGSTCHRITARILRLS
jgi:hypothetical protein